VIAARSSAAFGAGRESGSGAKLQISSSRVSPRGVQLSPLGMVIAASIFCGSESMPSSPQRATSSTVGRDFSISNRSKAW